MTVRRIGAWMTAGAVLVATSAGCTVDTQAPATAGDSGGVQLTELSTYSPGGGQSDVIAFDPVRDRLWIAKTRLGSIEVIDVADTRRPTKVASWAVPDVLSVAIAGEVAVVSAGGVSKTEPGTLTSYRAADFGQVASMPTGALPDMVTFTPDATTVLVAEEGEPSSYCAEGVDPEGGVLVVKVSAEGHFGDPRRADFTAFNGQRETLAAAGVHFSPTAATVAQDLEPEFIAVTADSSQAVVTLQENNAHALIDIASATVTGVYALGLKDFSKTGAGLDPSDKDEGIVIRPWTVSGLYQPDNVLALPYSQGAAQAWVSANEGDSRDYPCLTEAQRVRDLTLDPKVFPNASFLQRKEHLGRLKVSASAARTQAGYTSLVAFGGRSISTWDSFGNRLWDSGDALEQRTATEEPRLFNANNNDPQADQRSDDSGPEPEALTMVNVGGRTLVVVGMERVSGLAVFDLTDPRHGVLVGYASKRQSVLQQGSGTPDLGPESLVTLPVSANRRAPVIAVSNEISGTVTFWEIKGT